MAGWQRATRLGGLCGRLAALQLQQPGAQFSTLAGGLWGTESTSLVRQAGAGLSRLTSLIPSLADMAWLAAPKRKVGTAADTHSCGLGASLAPLPCLPAAAPLGSATHTHPPPHPPLHPQVTPHRKGNRSATKYIRFVPVVSQCRCAAGWDRRCTHKLHDQGWQAAWA